MRSIVVTRNNGWFGRIRAASIMADDVEIGQVNSGESVEVQVPDDSTHLYAKMDWGKSLPYPVENLTDGQTIYMNARLTLNPLRSFGILPIPVSLEDEPR